MPTTCHELNSGPMRKETLLPTFICGDVVASDVLTTTASTSPGSRSRPSTISSLIIFVPEGTAITEKRSPSSVLPPYRPPPGFGASNPSERNQLSHRTTPGVFLMARSICSDGYAPPKASFKSYFSEPNQWSIVLIVE